MALQEIQQHEVGAKITITPQEVDDFMRSASWKAFYNKEYHLEDILIALPEARRRRMWHKQKSKPKKC